MPSIASKLLSDGRISDARRILHNASSLSNLDKLAYSVVEAASGNETNAFDIAAGLENKDLPPSIVLEALLVAGRVDYSRGRWTDGANRFGKAKQIAVRLGDKRLTAKAVAAHTESLLHFSTLESAITNARQLRQTAIASGTAEELFEYRLILAEMESRLGHPHRAIRELELADVLLKNVSNPLKEARWNFIKSAVYASSGRWNDAYEAAASAYKLAKDSGATVMSEVALNNLAHTQIAVGRLTDARHSIATLAKSQRQSQQLLLARASNALTLALADSDLATATEIDSTTSPIADEFQGGSNSYGHWYRIARTHYLVLTNRADIAAEQVREAISRLDASADRTLLDSMRSAAAMAAAALGDGRRVIDFVSEIALGPLGRTPEHIASIEMVLGSIANLDNSEAFEHLDRAARVYGHLGHITGRSFALRDRSARHTKASDSLSKQDNQLNDRSREWETKQRQLLERTAALLDLASRPFLMGQEAISIINAISDESSAVISKRNEVKNNDNNEYRSDIKRRDRNTADKNLSLTIHLGNENERSYDLVVTPANDTSARIALLALQRLVANARALHAAQLAESERSALWPDPLPEQQLGFVCASESMLDLMRTTRRVAASHITVLITGETGTGKELLARAIHQCSPRSSSRFIPFNCTAVPRDMLDSQLFGYRRGAFTGAQEAFAGVIRGAAGGTLFLDEIGEVGLDVQPKLLRFLESSEVHPLGEPAPVTVDVRVVAATNADLDQLMAEGKFREDLFYRLNVVRLTIPPLRERREEIPLLLDHFLERSLKDAGKTGVRIAESTSEFLLLYAWPGNVRELANEVRRMVALAESGSVVMPEHLSPKIAATRRTVPVTERPLEPTELVVRRDQPLSAAVEHVERALIQDALRATGSVELAAKRLGLSRKGLYLKRQRLKIDD